MFVLTHDNAIAQLGGIIRPSHASYENVYRITLMTRVGITVLGEYSTKESADTAITALAIAIERQLPMFAMPRETTKENGTKSFDESDLASLKKRLQ